MKEKPATKRLATMTPREEANAIVCAAFRGNTILEDLHAGAPFTDKRMKELMLGACDNIEALLYLRDEIRSDHRPATLEYNDWYTVLDRVSAGEWDRWDKSSKGTTRALKGYVKMSTTYSIGAFDRQPVEQDID